ncbi:PKD domain-containing protein [Acidobacteriota bacterium]
MKKIFFMMLCAVLLIGLFPASAAAQMTVIYGDLTLNSPWFTTHWSDVWDLTKGDLTLSYTIDMSTINQPGTWDTFIWQWTTYVEVGLRGEDAGDWNPGPFGVYQGRCGGWMVSDSDTWTDSDGHIEARWAEDSVTGKWFLNVPSDPRYDPTKYPSPNDTQDLDDKHALQASGGRGEGDYDVLDVDWNTVLPQFGSGDNFGVWFDCDGVDQWQADHWGNLGPGGVGSGDTLRYNTGGIYNIVITYHAIDVDGDGDAGNDGLGVMFATVNGYPQGFYISTDSWNGPPTNYPAGLSFKGDMKHMQVFAGLWAPQDLFPVHDFGYSVLSNIEVTGYLGTSDPLVADFTFNSTTIYPFDIVEFTDATSGGMPAYTYEWNFGDGSPTSIEQNPAHAYATAGTYVVTLTVTPFRCVPKTVTKTITVASPGTGTPGYWKNHPEAWPVVDITIGGKIYAKAEARGFMLENKSKEVTYIMFRSLVAAKLNVLIGNEASCINATINAADVWMSDHPIGSDVKAGGKISPWRTGEPLYLMLDDYNNGLLCAPSRDLINE